MTLMKTALLSGAILVGVLGQSALADDKAKVRLFYDFLSNPTSSEHADKLKTVVAENWESIGDYSGKVKSRDKFLVQIGGFGKLVPDLDWQVAEMLQDGNRVIVRGHATGTPEGPFFGVDGKGKSFEIMSIDIHTLEDGKIVRTYHIEDWAGALGQLKGK